MDKKVITSSEKETLELGKKFAKGLKGGETIGLIGDLGSGKTVFTKGLAAGLGIKKHITSPTFVLMKIYEVGKPLPTLPFIKGEESEARRGLIDQLVHIDAYRLQKGDELRAIGVDDFFNDENCVTVIEWADRVKDVLPADSTIIRFNVVDNSGRKIEFLNL